MRYYFCDDKEINGWKNWEDFCFDVIRSDFGHGFHVYCIQPWEESGRLFREDGKILGFHKKGSRTFLVEKIGYNRVGKDEAWEIVKGDVTDFFREVYS